MYLAVHGYVGSWGTGKTYTAVVDAGKAARRYRVPVVSNLEIRYPPAWGVKVIVCDTIEDLMSYTDCVLLIDEIGIMMPSRFYAKLLAQTAMRWAQMRKYRVYEVFYTVQSMARVDTMVRELTWDVFEMRSFRMLGFFFAMQWQGSSTSRLDTKIGVRFVFINKEVYHWYDTMAVIGNSHLLED